MKLVLRSGIDLVDIARVEALVETGGDMFVGQVWTTAEQMYCQGNAQRLASRWGAKEATMKALGRGFPELDHLDIEVLSDLGMPPALHLHGGAAREADEQRLTEWSVSLSHETGLAIAQVVALGVEVHG